MPSLPPKVVILLATRNGAEFLQSQLDSFRVQTYAHWELLVSDDGSTDATIEIVNRFAGSVPQRVVIVPGPQKGFWQNFVALVRSESLDGDLFAYSDQDDIWFPEKLAKAVNWFAQRVVAIAGAVFLAHRTDAWRRHARGLCAVVRAPAELSECAGAEHRWRQYHGIQPQRSGSVARDAGRCRTGIPRLVDLPVVTGIGGEAL